jgi:hypothetical protein
MLITIEEFRRRVSSDRAGLVSRLQEETGRYGGEEAEAWETSLTKLSRAFQAPSFQPLHLFFGSRGNLALEYQMPAASSWADVVLLGRHEAASAAVIIELKDWTTAADKPGKVEGLIDRAGRQELHPSDQVRGYTEYCRRFHSAIEEPAKVHGCVLFTHQVYTHAYTAAPNEILARDYPIFTTADEDVGAKFPNYFRDRLTEPDEEFAFKFATGRYRQQRGFVAQIGAQILDPESTPFELLDNQRRAFALCKAVVEECFLTSTSPHQPKKRVVIVDGPPGSGKSAIAARLWASLVTNKRLPEGDVVFTTTSQSQNSNWSAIFDQLADEGGAGLVRKATIFTPLTTHQLGRLRREHGEAFLADASGWRGNLQLLKNLGSGFPDASRDCPYAVRGFDYDYVGILWLQDLIWRDTGWEANAESVHESGIINLARRARREGSAAGPAHRELLQRVTQAYRILLTRPLRGAYLWIPDVETRGFVERSLGTEKSTHPE